MTPFTAPEAAPELQLNLSPRPDLSMASCACDLGIQRSTLEGFSSGLWALTRGAADTETQASLTQSPVKPEVLGQSQRGCHMFWGKIGSSLGLFILISLIKFKNWFKRKLKGKLIRV